MSSSEIVIIILIVLLFASSYSFFVYGKHYGTLKFLKSLMDLSYFKRVEDFDSFNKYVSENGIVFVGDSLIQEYNTYEYFSNYKTFNRGIGGDTTSGVLKRIDNSIFQLKPKLVYLLIGTNDLNLSDFNINNSLSNMSEIISLIAKNSDIKVKIISLLPVNSNVDKNTVGKRTNETIIKYNTLLQEKFPNYYLNYFHEFLDEDTNLNKIYTRDGLHLNYLGYEKLTKLLVSDIENK